MNSQKLPPGFVPKYYSMDPDIEDLLPRADYLANGMVVLVENDEMRADEEEMRSSVRGMARALKRNRWCTVSNLYWDSDANAYRFVGVYENGTKRSRFAPRNSAWLVKLDSIPDALEHRYERYENVLELVQKAMCSEEVDKDAVAEGITKQILGVV